MEKEEKIIFCRRCGRKLRGTYSKELEFGPVCYKLWKKEREENNRLFQAPTQKEEHHDL